MGDEVLVKSAARLQQILPAEGIVGRVGGDEFVAYLPKAETLAQVETIAHAVVGAFADSTGGLTVSSSVGVVICQNRRCGSKSQFKKADEALHRAKRNGKGQFTVSGSEIWRNSSCDAGGGS